ncbi:MAG: transglutaminase-like domain-containing protein [Alicyclobacillus sp.]|nr:transglutaminase-like domain-containing protein [Alicyclobacillus sp.]
MADAVTALFLLVLAGSALRGAQRGFAAECGYVLSRGLNLLAAALALVAGWWMSNEMAAWLQHTSRNHWPHVVQPLLDAWRQSPGTARLLLFAAWYLVWVTVLKGLMSPLPYGLARLLPQRWAGNRWGGAAAGLLLGSVRCIAGAGVLYLGFQAYPWPALTQAAADSPPYRWLSQTLFQPVLQPWAVRTLPVLTSNALQPLTRNISLFVLPAPAGETERGLVVVPTPIQALARQLTAGQTTDRGKAYALYEWEIHHIHYDWQKYDDFVYHQQWDAQSPLQTLQTGRGVCADYALLYADMAHAVGLTVRIDEGLGGSAGEVGPHAWNEVWDGSNQRWLQVDTTWGAEQDAWFDPAGFAATHHLQHTIEIEGARR